MNGQVVGLVAQLRADALHVVVVHEVVELDMRWYQPARSPNGMGDLEVVMVVVAAVECLVQGVVRHAVERALVGPARVVAVDDLAHQPEIGLQGIDRLAQGFHELEVQHVGGVQPDAIHIELAHPEANHIADIVPYGRVALVELCQQVIPTPVVI